MSNTQPPLSDRSKSLVQGSILATDLLLGMLSMAIAAQPSGDRRNTLTVINLHTMEIMDLLKKLQDA